VIFECRLAERDMLKTVEQFARFLVFASGEFPQERFNGCDRIFG